MERVLLAIDNFNQAIFDTGSGVIWNGSTKRGRTVGLGLGTFTQKFARVLRWVANITNSAFWWPFQLLDAHSNTSLGFGAAAEEGIGCN